jgi:hypothetical protein
MMRFARIFGLAVTMLVVLGCEARTDKADGGGILLTIQSFDGLPIAISASGSGGIAQIGTIVVRSVVKNPDRGTSDLMKVEIDSYEVTFERDDTGTRVPPRLKEFLFGTIDPGGTFTLNNGPFMRVDQFNNVPIRDLIDFGVDQQTGSAIIRLKVGIQFFGRTITGKTVESAPGYFTLEVFP